MAIDKAIVAKLEEYIYELCTPSHYVPEWCELIAYCLGYYGQVTVDMIDAVRLLKQQGKVK